MYEGTWRRNQYSKLTICDFLLMVNGNHGRIFLIICEGFAYTEVENRHFRIVF